jgi:2-keto-4-pentenoate hydratase/2-oxohepta-3-ene-1,7-dioic acid hydratase in catechol pathway
MRLVTYELDRVQRVGVEVDGKVRATGFHSMLDLIRAGRSGLDVVQAGANDSRAVTPDRLLAPLPNPGKILACGVNFRRHGIPDPSFAPPGEPSIDGIKLPSAIVGPGQPIAIPAEDGVIARPGGFEVDYEVELGVIIGRHARRVAARDALAFVFGYTIFNDVSARRVQLTDRQPELGRNFDTFAPMGPCIVTADELPDPRRARISCLVNDELRQDAVLTDQLFGVPELIEWISSIITLEPGDAIMTGTPAGSGLFRDPPVWLRPGDVLVSREATIGELRNPVVAG